MKTTPTIVLIGLSFLLPETAKPAVVSLARWFTFDSAAATFPRPADGKAVFITSATTSYSGLTPISDSRGVWRSRTNPSAVATTLDTATAPYLSWTLNPSSPTTFSEFIFGGLADGNNSLVQLRSSADGFASSLGQIDPTGSFVLYSLDLSPIGTVSSPIEFRAYVYNSTAPFGDLFVGFGAGSIYGVEIMGQAVPEPSAGALLMLGAGGVFALRRLRRKGD